MRRATRITCLKWFPVIFFILLLVVALDTVCAETLGTRELSGSSYEWNNLPVNSIRFDLMIWGQTDSTITIAHASNGDAGRTFTVTSGSPQFSTLASWLTNGSQDNLVLFAMGPNGGGGPLFSETSIQKLYNNGPDFAGFQIETISMTLNDFVLKYPVSIPDMPEAGPNWNYMRFDATLSFNGSPVPEPATIVLLGLGAAMLRRKK